MYSCRPSGEITLNPHEVKTIYCPVNALSTDRVIVTSNDPIIEVLGARPFGNVIIWIKNDREDRMSWNFGTNGFSIMVFTGEVKGYEGTPGPFC